MTVSYSIPNTKVKSWQIFLKKGTSDTLFFNNMEEFINNRYLNTLHRIYYFQRARVM